jgi:hypothetical protein
MLHGHGQERNCYGDEMLYAAAVCCVTIWILSAVCVELDDKSGHFMSLQTSLDVFLGPLGPMRKITAINKYTCH